MTRTPNCDAQIHNLKVKIEYVVEKLPQYDTFSSYKIETFDEDQFAIKMKGLNRQRLSITKSSNELIAMYNNVKVLYDVIIKEYMAAPESSRLTDVMNRLEDEKGIAALLLSMENKITEIEGIRLEIEGTIEFEKEMNKNERVEDKVISESSQPETKKLNKVQLNKVDVPDFEGEPENFCEFIAAYDELVHRNIDLSAIEKAIRLKNALKGKAHLCIKGIPVTSENYQTMYNKMIRKFQKGSVNRHTIVQKLENLTVAGSTAEECNNKLNEIEVLLNQLESADMGISDSNNLVFHRMILQKFPKYMRRALISKTKSEDFTVEDLMDALESKIFDDEFVENAEPYATEKQPQAYKKSIAQCNQKPQFDDDFVEKTEFSERYQSTNNVTQRPYNHASNSGQFTSRPNIIRNFVPRRNNTNAINEPCIFCPNDNHAVNDCPLPIQEKKDILRSKRACWKCFGTNHANFQCTYPDCPCGGLHHPSLCQQRISRGVENNLNSNQMNFKQVNDNNTGNNHPTSTSRDNRKFSYGVHTTSIKETEEAASNRNDEQNNLQSFQSTIDENQDKPPNSVLMTCSASILHPEMKRHAEGSLFFDSGAQRTLISEKFAKIMQLRIVANEQYIIGGINRKSKLIQGKVVEVILKDTQGNCTTIHALTKPDIGEGFKAAELDTDDLNFLREHRFETFNSHIKGEKVCTDILIGADYYYELVKNVPSTQLPSGLRVVETIFGSTIFGIPRLIKTGRSENVTYVNHSCVVNIIPERERKAARYAKPTKERLVGIHSRLDSNINLQTTTVKKGTLPDEIFASLKRRTVGSMKLRNARFTSPLKTRQLKKPSNHKPSRQKTIAILPLVNSRDIKGGILKQNKKGSRSEQTSINFVERIQQVSTRVENKQKVKANKCSKGTENGKLIH